MSRPGKPAGLVTRAETKAKKAQRAQKEDALRPSRALPRDPARLKDYPVARATWRAIMREYNDIEGVIVTRLDYDHLIDYCMLHQHLAEIDMMRNTAYRIWLELSKVHDELANQEKADDAVVMAIKVVDAYAAVRQLDTRSERKRALIKQWRESLYLTPRARAGTAPAAKEPEEQDDPMAKLLNNKPKFMADVKRFMNETE